MSLISTKIDTRCVISGGGPAGVMLGFLLARSGIDVTVLEKWPDFFRDFRGDTIHPSTMELMRELGLLEKFLALPHDETRTLGVRFGPKEFKLADFSGLRTPFIAFMPQWDFLDFLAKEAKQYPAFHLMMHTEATELLEEDGRVVGVVARHEEKDIEIRAELVVGADGRHSTVREKANLKAMEYGTPIDVLWFRISRLLSDPKQTMGLIDEGRFMVMIERGNYWQCAFVIKKGHFEEMKKGGLEHFRAYVGKLSPFLEGRTEELRSWEDIKYLSVAVDRLLQWSRPGLVCIGDAAHAMSPIGGVGINLAVQDAVATANILVPAFQRGTPSPQNLRAIQVRRMYPVRATQFFQILLQNQVIARVLGNRSHPRPPFILRLLQFLPVLQRIPARLIGIGVRPEHCKTQTVAFTSTRSA